MSAHHPLHGARDFLRERDRGRVAARTWWTHEWSFDENAVRPVGLPDGKGGDERRAGAQ